MWHSQSVRIFLIRRVLFGRTVLDQMSTCFSHFLIEISLFIFMSQIPTGRILEAEQWKHLNFRFVSADMKIFEPEIRSTVWILQCGFYTNGAHIKLFTTKLTAFSLRACSALQTHCHRWSLYVRHWNFESQSDNKGSVLETVLSRASLRLAIRLSLPENL